jgi:hypothetical protein
VDNLSSDFEELLALFNVHNVRAVIVGGRALAFHGRPRYTKDLDIFLEPSDTNAAALMRALEDFGFGSVGLTPQRLRWRRVAVSASMPSPRKEVPCGFERSA